MVRWQLWARRYVLAMEASGQAQWFEGLREGLGVELWRGDAEVIRAKRGRKQKTDREDALSPGSYSDNAPVGQVSSGNQKCR
jgi:hypothetical protein